MFSLMVSNFARTVALLLLSSIALAQTESLDVRIIGIWQLQVDSDTLHELGRADDDPQQVRAEVEFRKNGELEMRTIDPKAFGTRAVHRIEGTYFLRKGRLQMKVFDTWNGHDIEIVDGRMNLRADNPTFGPFSDLIKIDAWTITD
jgi:hypothetical protein